MATPTKWIVKAAVTAMPTCRITPRKTELAVAKANVAPIPAAPATPAATESQTMAVDEEKNHGISGNNAPIAKATKDHVAATIGDAIS